MNTLTKMALGILGQLKSARAAGHGRMSMVAAAQRHPSWLSAGAMAQSACLYCAGAGLATLIRAWIDRHALSQAIGLSAGEQVLVAQTVGVPASGGCT